MGELVQLAERRSRDPRGERINKKELAEELKLSVAWINKEIEKEKKSPGSGIPFHKMGLGEKSAVRFFLSEVNERLDRRNTHAA